MPLIILSRKSLALFESVTKNFLRTVYCLKDRRPLKNDFTPFLFISNVTVVDNKTIVR